MSLTDLLEVFRSHLYLPDPGPVEVVLGAVVANRLPGDPVWLLLVGPPASGKTEMLASLSGLDGIHEVSTFTEAGLLSGSTSHQPGATGGLLVEVGANGIIVCKDFTSLLSESADTRSGLLAALREIYDGRWVRRLGVEGGRTIGWFGKAGLLAGVTETIDRHAAVIGAMGERMALYRMPALDNEGRLTQGRAALNNVGHQPEMRAELRETVVEFLDGLALPAESEPLEDATADWLVLLTDLATRCRSVLERDLRGERAIELVPEPEAIARLQAVLAQLTRGLWVIGVDDDRVSRLVVKVALDGMPKHRRQVVEVVVNQPTSWTTSDLAARLGLPSALVHRELQDLAAFEVVERLPRKAQGEDAWRPSEWLLDRWDRLGLSGDERAKGDEPCTDVPSALSPDHAGNGRR